MSAVPQASGGHADAYRQAYASAGMRARALQRRPRILRLAAYAACAFCLGIAAAVTVPSLVGYQSFTVLSGSMEPTISTGDVVVVAKIVPLEAQAGDVVTFPSPEDPSRVLTHRVRSVEAVGGTVRFVTRGDANTGVERWTVPADGVIGRVSYRIPKLGYVANRVGSRFGRFAFLVLPALLLAGMELRRIWRPRNEAGKS